MVALPSCSMSLFADMESEKDRIRRLYAGFGVLACILLLVALLYYPPLFSLGDPPVAMSISEPQVGVAEKINLNTADAERLQTLPGIGPARAEAIVAYRQQHGNFSSVEDLLEVKGIGEKILAGIEDYVFV